MSLHRVVITIAFAALALSCRAGEESDTLILRLTEEIGRKADYDRAKEHLLQVGKEALDAPDMYPMQRYAVTLDLARQYRKYMLDSAIVYARKSMDIAEAMHNEALRDEASLYLSQFYSNAGFYLEAERLLDGLRARRMTNRQKALYYKTCQLFWDSYGGGSGKSDYYALATRYRDSLLSVLDTAMFEYKVALATKRYYSGQTEEAEKTFLAMLAERDEHDGDYGMLSYFLASIYQQRGNTGLERRYFALSAIADIKNSIKDNASIRSLADYYHRRGHFELAHRLMQSAIDDLAFCHVRFRANDLLSVYAIVNTAYMESEAQNNSNLRKYLLWMGILLALLIGAIFWIALQMRKVSKIRKRLYDNNMSMREMNRSVISSNEELRQLNVQLSEANQVKEEYIAHFFDLCSDYITKWENYRKTLHRKAGSNQTEEMMNMLKSNTLVEDEWRKLYATFDMIFLNLYPTFVDDLNRLLLPEKQIALRQGELLNPELRIFALVRLGISDSMRIASFLRYSISTIYNYRTQMRNRAIARDVFEQDIMKIGIKC